MRFEIRNASSNGFMRVIVWADSEEDALRRMDQADAQQ